MIKIMPGDRVLVFDSSLFRDDVSTPLSMTMKPATVICRYGRVKGLGDYGNYPDLCDVQFDHKPGISKAHFTSGIKKL